MKNEEINIKKENGMIINPKFYPLVWIVLIIASFFKNFYQIYFETTGYESVLVKVYYGFVSFIVNGGSGAVLVFLLAMIVHSMGARRGLLHIPRNEFIYVTMTFMSVAWFVVGVANLFSFLDPAVLYCNVFTTEPAVITVAMALMFFLVLSPRYLNPKQAHRNFAFYGKLYVIFNAIVYIMGGVGVLSCIAIADDPALLQQMSNVYYTTVSGDIPIAKLFEMYSFAKLGMEISAYITLALAVGMIVAYFVLANMLKTKAKDFKEEVKPENMEGIYFTDGKNFYRVDDLKNNPFGADDAPDKNPFDDDDKGDDKVFEEFDL